MSSEFNKTVRDFAKALQDAGSSKTSPYDTQATVKRIEGNIAWVHIPGGVDETPVQLTTNAKKGDVVQVRVSGGTAWITGNATSPPTDDTKANQAENRAIVADENATNALTSADLAQKFADEAKDNATEARSYAVQAKETTDEINAYADTAGKTVTQILNDGETAGVAAQEAKTSAENASEYAARALGNLSTVQSVTETLDWITTHGTMTLTSDIALDPTHVYFVRDANGDYHVGSYYYSVVTEPNVNDISTYYELSIDESLNNYVGTHLALTSEGLWLLPSSTGTYKVLIATGAGSTYTSAGMYIIDNMGKTMAKYMDNIIIGIDDGTQSYMYLDYHSMQLIDKEGNSYFWVSDLRDKDDDWKATITQVEKGNGIRVWFDAVLQPTRFDEFTATDSSDPTNIATLDYNARQFTFDHAPSDGATVTIVYKTESDLAKAFTIGCRGTGSIGAYSIACGLDVVSSGYASFAEGGYTKASGPLSHAEGSGTEASGDSSHAEGSGTFAIRDASHAEGNGTNAVGSCSHAEGSSTTANGNNSHAEGFLTTANDSSAHAEGEGSVANGSYSHAQNYYTITNSNAQTAIGKFNIEDLIGDQVLIIGNGTADDARSNALTVDWQGYSEQQGRATTKDMTAGSGGEVEDFVNSLNVTAIHAVDYVVEQGTSDGWLYRKWNSGRFEAWTQKSVTSAITSQVGQVFQSSASITINLPSAVTATAIYTAEVSPFLGTYGVWRYMTGASTTAISFRFMSGISRASATYTVRGYVMGTYS